MSDAHGECAFCSIRKPIAQTELALAIFDRYAVSSRHALILPKRHIGNLFDTIVARRTAMFALLFELKQQTDDPAGAGWLQRRHQYRRRGRANGHAFI